MVNGLSNFSLCILCLLIMHGAAAQEQPVKDDTFFLSKKKGLLGQLGKSISTSGVDIEPAKKINPYLQYEGKIIRSIRVLRLGFERDINDTSKYNISFGTIVTNAFHTKSRERVIRNNLFFKAGEPLQPYLMADNERHFREQPFIQDALIKIDTVEGSTDSVDVLVLTKDVFSLGGSADISNLQKFRLEVRDENFRGAGSRLSFSSFYDKERLNPWGTGLDFIKRNWYGSFINFNMGYRTYSNDFSSGRQQENTYYMNFDKPLVSPYFRWIGGLDVSYNKTQNNYFPDSLYRHLVKYGYGKADGWFGYNFGASKLSKSGIEERTRRLGAIRVFYQHFDDIPQKVKDTFDYRFTNVSGVLGSFIIFRQNFTRTNFIYGFGRNEDVPQGFNIAAIGGWISKKDSISSDVRKRPYFGIDASISRFNSKGFFSNYTLRLGGYTYKGKWEDLDLLLNVDHFTRKKVLSREWLYRQFYSLGITRQFYPVLNAPLYLRSIFGLPYFGDLFTPLDFRATVKTEAVFYNLRRFWGFRFAPFAFADVSVIKPVNTAFIKSDLYSAIGAGVRTRNENLIFGTIELKGYFFPRTLPGMTAFKAEIGTNIRFKYNSTFVRKPDFVNPN